MTQFIINCRYNNYIIYKLRARSFNMFALREPLA